MQDMPDITTPKYGELAFMGYFDTYNPATGEVSGTQYYYSNGTSAHVWDKPAGATLYAK